MSLVKQAIILELQDYAKKAMKLKSQMDNSKTELKRNLFKKKLKKNNTEAVELLQALSRLVAKEQAETAINGANDEVSVLAGGIEEKDGLSESME
jgi:hypothetical protein